MASRKNAKTNSSVAYGVYLLGIGYARVGIDKLVRYRTKDTLFANRQKPDWRDGRVPSRKKFRGQAMTLSTEGAGVVIAVGENAKG